MVACCLDTEEAGSGSEQTLGSRPRTLSPKKRGNSETTKEIHHSLCINYHVWLKDVVRHLPVSGRCGFFKMQSLASCLPRLF